MNASRVTITTGGQDRDEWCVTEKENAMMEKTTIAVALGAVVLAGAAFGESDCKYNGATFSHGSAACQSGTQYRCDDGEWTGLGIACTDGPPAAARSCAFNGTTYSPGSASCQSSTQYRCDDGAWVSLSVACVPTGQSGGQMPAAARTCMYEGATVATDSSICRSGVTFRCSDGEWLNLGTACR